MLSTGDVRLRNCPKKKKGVRKMGLSASQARLLNLTARMHDIEYKAQNLEAQKLQMANESTQVYQEYENALNKQKIQFKQIGADGSANYVDASLNTLFDAGYKVRVQDKDGNWTDCADLAAVNKATGKTISGTSTETLRNMVEAGFIVFEKPTNEVDENGDKIYAEVNIATDTSLQEVSDETELKKAEAKYEADMRKINAKDKKFDTDLAAMEQERNAIKTEIDTLKSVAKDNVDRTFKLFS